MNSVNYVSMTQFLVCNQSSSVGLCLQDYKPLRVAIMSCATHADTDGQLLTGCTISSVEILLVKQVR